jgi:excisionase family DNA binding protein
MNAIGDDRRQGRLEMLAEINPEWVTYKQAEELSGLSRTTLWKLVSASEIEAARVGRAVRINRDSLTAYMKRAAENSVGAKLSGC